MTHQELKAIIDGGEYCIQCPSDYATNERWKKYISHVDRSCEGTVCHAYYSPTIFSHHGNIRNIPESKTVLTLDQWWSVMGDEHYGLKVGDVLKEDVVSEWRRIHGWYHCKSYSENTSGFIGDRFIEAFDKVNDTTVFLVSNTNDICLRAEGFKEFAENFGKQGVTYTDRIIEQDDTAAAWQPKEGEMVEVSDSGDRWLKRVYIGMYQGWHITSVSIGEMPIGWKHIRPIQNIPVSLDDLKAAYAEKHNIDVNKITVT